MADESTGPMGTEAEIGLAYRRMALEHLEASGFEFPQETLEGLYRERLPSESEYEAEVKSFEKDYREAMRKAAYFRAIEEIAGEDAGEFRRLYGFGADEAGRQRHGGPRYAELVAQIPAFAPPSAEEYYSRFDDHPLEIHEQVYGEAIELARARLIAERGNRE
ncbi:MAG: hypothetical protein OXE40_03895 [Gammaproteobacteria bacterium]|nr:hypothetical protein [Gammaproteobacteria bacterium]